MAARWFSGLIFSTRQGGNNCSLPDVSHNFVPVWTWVQTGEPPPLGTGDSRGRSPAPDTTLCPGLFRARDTSRPGLVDGFFDQTSDCITYAKADRKCPNRR